jgi:hypothetical protein
VDDTGYVACSDIRAGLRRLLPFAELLAREYPGRESAAGLWMLNRLLTDPATVAQVASREQ